MLCEHEMIHVCDEYEVHISLKTEHDRIYLVTRRVDDTGAEIYRLEFGSVAHRNACLNEFGFSGLMDLIMMELL